MSSPSFRPRRAWWLLTFALVAGLGIRTEARAGGKVDWSEYIEPAGTAHPIKVFSEHPAAAKPVATAKKTTPSVKRHATESRSKAKPPARSGRHR